MTRSDLVPVYQVPLWIPVPLMLVSSALSIYRFSDGTWWQGCGWGVLAVYWLVQLWRRLGLFSDGESLLLRRELWTRRVPIEVIRALDERQKALVLQDGSSVKIGRAVLTLWRPLRQQAFSAIAQWLRQIESLSSPGVRSAKAASTDSR